MVFGSDLVSYLRSSTRSVQAAVKSSVPIEFELQRAGDLLEEIIPEMHANIRLIAQEEVEIESLKSDIQGSTKLLGDEKSRISKLRGKLDMQFASLPLGDRQVSRSELKNDLVRRFDRFKESQLVLESKRRLLVAREKSLKAAIGLLERTRSQKRLLEGKIEALAGKYRLVKAAAVGSHIKVDSSKLAQTEKLIRNIKKRLDVAERVLAHESRFVQPLDIDVVSEADVLAEIDEYFNPAPSVDPSTAGALAHKAGGDALTGTVPELQ